MLESQMSLLQVPRPVPVVKTTSVCFGSTPPSFDSQPSRGRATNVKAAAFAAGLTLAARQVSTRRLRRRWQRRSAEKDSDPPLLELGVDTPGNAWSLGVRTFKREWGQLIHCMRDTPLFHGLALWLEEHSNGIHATAPPRPPPFVKKLTLDVEAVKGREETRGVPPSTPAVQAIFFVLCWMLDRLYEGRPIQKFWVLETVARLPYFSYITVLHLYESLGWWRTPQLRAVHNAEEDNELHHLLIMEALGGGCQWFDRFVAQHAALTYYWLVVGLFIVQPSLAYNFSLLVEEHAYVTYSQFADENKEILQKLPAPPIAAEYYRDGDLYLFDKFHTGGHPGARATRRPPCDNLLDVFTNIRDDELEHVRTMQACQQWWGGGTEALLPQDERQVASKRKEWQRWSTAVNRSFVESPDTTTVASAAASDFGRSSVHPMDSTVPVAR